MTPTETAMAKAKANQKKRRKTSKLTLSRQSMKKALNNLRKKTPKKTKSPRKKRKSSRKKSSKKCKICGFDCDVGMFNMNACTCNHTNCRGYKLSKRQISLAKEFGDRVFSLKMDQMTSAQLAMERAKLNRLSGKVNLSEIVQFTDYGEQIVRGVPSKKLTPSQIAMERARNNRRNR